MNKILWVVQILLALAFVMAGAMKLFTPIADLAAQMGWPDESSALLVRFIGLAEVCGALGLILPSALRIRPSLTPLAAACQAHAFSPAGSSMSTALSSTSSPDES